MRVTNMQLAHSNNRPPVPYTAYTAPLMDKSPKKRLNAILSSIRDIILIFSCNKLLISSTKTPRLIFEADHIFEIEDLSKKTFSPVIASPSLPPVFSFHENIWENTFLEQFSEHISPEIQLSKGINLWWGFADIYIWAGSFTCAFLASWEFLKL